MRKSLFTPLSYLVLALVAASPAVAEPPVPSWQRGGEGTTYQAWDFQYGSIAPDELDNPYGRPELSGHFQQFIFEIDDKQGIYALRHEIDIVVPNSNLQNPYKDIMLYLVWKPMDESFIKDAHLPDSPLVAVTPFDEMQMNKNDVIENGWHYSTYDITIWPNPDKEWFTVKGNILVDHIAIDTICVPEPATITIIAFGMLAAVRRRKKG